jgi:hypothetical protein
MNELIKSIDALLLRLATTAAIANSMEWYLQNNLRDYKATLQRNPSARDIKNATDALTRFCTESMDWDNLLYRDCCDITARGGQLAKP